MQNSHSKLIWKREIGQGNDKKNAQKKYFGFSCIRNNAVFK